MFEDDSQALDECIRIYREGLTLAPLSDPSRARSYTNLAQAVRKRFDGVEIANYIDELRGLYREAAALCLPDDLGSCLENLAKFVRKDERKEIHNRGEGTVALARHESQDADRNDDGILRFNQLLLLHNAESPLTGFTLEVHRLAGEYPQRQPDVTVGNKGNMVDRSNHVWLSSGQEARYGFTIRNKSQEDMFAYLFYFDPDEYTIQVRWNPNVSSVNSLLIHVC
jgi:hypothetical protein